MEIYNAKKIGIFIDLDGTLLNNEWEISQRTKKAIKKLTKLGVEIIIVTGKSLISAMHDYEYLNLKTPMITSMGQVISNPSDPKYQTKEVGMDQEKINKFIADKEFSFLYTNFLIDATKKFYVKKNCKSQLISLIRPSHTNIEEYKNQISSQIIAFYLEMKPATKNELLKLVTKISKKYIGEFVASYWDTQDIGNKPIINIKPYSVDKWNAAKQIKEERKYDYVISFGDGWNDRNMLNNSNRGYAMLNAYKSVKNYASHITKYTNNNDGVAYELEKIIQEYNI